MYPTLSELAGLTMPSGDAGAYLDGQSLVPVMVDPVNGIAKTETLSQFPRCFQNNTHHSGGKPGDENNRTSSWESMSDCHWVDRMYIDFMGYKMRTHNASITVWSVWVRARAVHVDHHVHAGVVRRGRGAPHPRVARVGRCRCRRRSVDMCTLALAFPPTQHFTAVLCVC